MNTEQENPEENQPTEDEIESTPAAEESLPEDEPWEEKERASSPLDSDFDVDAALASIAALSDLGADEDDEDADDEDDFERDDEDSYENEYEDYESQPYNKQENAADVVPVRATVKPVNAPPIYDFSRGQLASIVPALALMIYGAWLTFALSTDAVPTLTKAVVFALIAVGISMLGYWFSSGRSASGAAMVGLLLISIPATLYFINANDLLGNDGWPLIVVAVGAAQFLSSILSKGSTARSGFTGLLMMLMGGFAYALTSNTLDFDVDQSADILLPVLGVVAVILLIAPLLPRKR